MAGKLTYFCNVGHIGTLGRILLPSDVCRNVLRDLVSGQLILSSLTNLLLFATRFYSSKFRNKLS